jgi:hypothetical protein
LIGWTLFELELLTADDAEERGEVGPISAPSAASTVNGPVSFSRMDAAKVT